MSDVDAIRCMASEHDLEFVDLDTYGVDPAAGEILPAELARRHHMVAIKRKFGTPVIATSDPDNLYAQDSVRASLGRDFISVVASREQISDYLDQLFGADIGDEQTKQTGRLPPTEDGLEQAEEGLGDKDVDAGSSGPTDVDHGSVVVGPEAEPSPDDLQAVTLVTDLPDLRSELAVDLASEAPTDLPASTNGRRGKKSDRKGKGSVAAAPAEPKVSSDGSEWQDLTVGTQLPDVVEEPRADGEEVARPTAVEDVEELVEAIVDEESGRNDGEAHVAGTPEGTGAEPPTLEPATSLLPTFGADTDARDVTVVEGTPVVSTDELAELARSVEGSEEAPSADSTVQAADLVAEAVATFQEQHGDEQHNEVADSHGASATVMFPPLARDLVEGGRVSLEDMEEVLEEYHRTGHSIAHILTERKLVTEADLMWGMAEEMGLEFVDLDTVGVDFTEAGTIPEATARHHNVIVIKNDNGTPVVAASNPTDVFAMDDLRTIMGRNFIVVVATHTQISAYIGRVFNSGGDAADMAMEASLGFDGSSGEPGVDDIQAITEEAPIVRYVNLLILQALNERASDIHVEPTGTDLRIRYRIDGVLHDVSTAPRAISAAVTTRLKVMADMNVAEHRIPQDGRISLNVGSKGIDLRMATLPTIHGEKVVMRVLDKSSVVLGFADLGFDEDLLHTYESIYTKPYGTILVTGPTGSGKSTTLYTTLTALNSPEKNIITVEDPVELQLRGVNQVQLNVKAGLTFASALRSILRSDPDVVLVGEIRDKETAVIAVEAALTGHMVLATLHTNSAASTPMRLIEMGLEPFLVTSSLSAVLAQRLARRLCMHCKEAYEPSEADIAAAGWTLEEVEAAGGMTKVFRASGCSACANTGYRGRKALAELMPMSEEIERIIIEGGSVEDIHKLAVAQGMLTLRQSGLRKAIEGETTLEEVLRVVA